MNELKLISGKKDRDEFIKSNLNDLEFIQVMKFLLDDNISTGTSNKKLDKIRGHKIDKAGDNFNLLAAIEYLKEYSTGKIEDLKYIWGMNTHLISYELSQIFIQIACKQFSMGVQKKHWNKLVKPVNKDFMVPDIPYLGCQSYSKKRFDKLFEDNEYVISQLKCDGQFLTVVVEDGIVQDSYSRAGIKQYFGCEDYKFIQEINTNSKGDFALIGELLSDKISDRGEANGMIRSLVDINTKLTRRIIDLKEMDKLAAKFKKRYNMSVHEAAQSLRFIVWDKVDLEDFWNYESKEIYEERWFNLQEYVEYNRFSQVELVETVQCFTPEEAMKHLKDKLTAGYEGTVLKSPKEGFLDKKPDWQIKNKLEMEIDLKIVGFKQGKPDGKYKHTLGALICESECGNLNTGVSGIKDKMRDELWFNQEKYLNKIVTIKCNGISSNNNGGTSLFYANLIEIRDDKTEANTFIEIEEIEKSALCVAKNNIELV